MESGKTPIPTAWVSKNPSKRAGGSQSMIRSAAGVSVAAANARGDIRRFRRAKVKVPVRVAFRERMKTLCITGQGTDIGRGGLGVLVPADLSLGSRVMLEIDLPRPFGKIQLAAIVRNRQECYYGVEFLDEQNGLELHLRN
jgi:hypothetical protein